jgi:hypothetical protein
LADEVYRLTGPQGWEAPVTTSGCTGHQLPQDGYVTLTLRDLLPLGFFEGGACLVTQVSTASGFEKTFLSCRGTAVSGLPTGSTGESGTSNVALLGRPGEQVRISTRRLSTASAGAKVLLKVLSVPEGLPVVKDVSGVSGVSELLKAIPVADSTQYDDVVLRRAGGASATACLESGTLVLFLEHEVKPAQKRLKVQDGKVLDARGAQQELTTRIFELETTPWADELLPQPTRESLAAATFAQGHAVTDTLGTLVSPGHRQALADLFRALAAATAVKAEAGGRELSAAVVGLTQAREAACSGALATALPCATAATLLAQARRPQMATRIALGEALTTATSVFEPCARARALGGLLNELSGKLGRADADVLAGEVALGEAADRCVRTSAPLGALVDPAVRGALVAELRARREDTFTGATGCYDTPPPPRALAQDDVDACSEGLLGAVGPRIADVARSTANRFCASAVARVNRRRAQAEEVVKVVLARLKEAGDVALQPAAYITLGCDGVATVSPALEPMVASLRAAAAARATTALNVEVPHVPGT